MKELHLICESHLDPIWLWDWQEGASAAISTFQSAVNLAGEFDYIFCHNEVTLYKYVEEYAPDLFKEIQRLVKAGKWHIMGGWYLQPDCNMPSGESFVRQILVGRKYFQEKFGEAPTTAINFDSFGHSRGLVQIIRKCGQDSYIFVRPFKEQLKLEDDYFLWEGLDGSRLPTFRSPTYNSLPFGNAANHIREVVRDEGGEHEVWLCLWGVGNHGGGPSRQDLKDIQEMMGSSDIRIIHSTPEAFFKASKPAAGRVVDESLRTSMPGCYVSNSLMKRKHIQLENQLYYTEKILTAANLSDRCEYPQEELTKAEEDLLVSEFHDMITGTVAYTGADNGVCMLQHGLFILDRLKTRAYFALSQDQPSAKPGEYPIVVFNPHPYPLTADIECEFGLADQNHDKTKQSRVTVYDGDTRVDSQLVKENSNLNLDWRKHVIFRAALPPMGIKRFSAYIDFEPYNEPEDASTKDIVFENDKFRAVISRKTGLLTSWKVGGMEYLSGGAFAPFLYECNDDPYAMGDDEIAGLGKNPVPMKLAKHPDGVMRGRRPVQIVEDGPVCLSVESIFQSENAAVRLLWVIHKLDADLEVKASVIWCEKNRMLKLRIPTTLKDGAFLGETAFGTEELYRDGRECPAQRFVALKDELGKVFGVLNNCIYGCSEEDGVLSLSLIRGAAFGTCPGPFPERPLVKDRFVPYLDQGQQDYEFRLTVCGERELARKALELNQPPFALNIFPAGAAKKIAAAVRAEVSDPNVVLAALKKSETGKGYVARLLNNSSENVSACFSLAGSKIELEFGRYEAKTILYRNGKLSESVQMMI